MNIFYTSKFEKSFKRLPREIQILALKKEGIFREEMFHPSLRTHKLSWALSWYYSFSIDYSYRIMFEKESNWDIIFLNVWGHSIYK